MVRAHRHPGDLHSVFSRPRPAARARADDDAGGRGRNERVVYETDAARGRTRLHVRLSAYSQEKVATDFRADIARGDTGYLSAAPVQSQLRHASRGLVCTEPSG